MTPPPEQFAKQISCLRSGGGVTPPPPSNVSFVYLLQSKKDGNFYLGWTTNLERRLEEHNSGKVRSTKNRIPFELVYYETYRNKEEAKHRERTLKHNSRMYFLLRKRVLNGQISKTCAQRAQKEVVG